MTAAFPDDPKEEGRKAIADSRAHAAKATPVEHVVHDDFACAVGEAPILIVKLLERIPSKLEISGGDLMNFHKVMTKEPCA